MAADPDSFADHIYYDRLNATQRSVVDNLVDLTTKVCKESAFVDTKVATIDKTRARRLWSIWFQSQYQNRSALNDYLLGTKNYEKLFDFMEPVFKQICLTSVPMVRNEYLFDRFKQVTPSFWTLLYGGRRIA